MDEWYRQRQKPHKNLHSKDIEIIKALREEIGD